MTIITKEELKDYFPEKLHDYDQVELNIIPDEPIIVTAFTKYDTEYSNFENTYFLIDHPAVSLPNGDYSTLLFILNNSELFFGVRE